MRDSAHCLDCDHEGRGAKGRRVEQEFVHGHVHDHDDCEEREEGCPDESGVL